MSYQSNKSYLSHRSNRLNVQSGFTLIEILVVMAIFIIIAGFALFVSMDSYRGYSFRSERDTAVIVLQKARSQAMSNSCVGSCSGNDGLKHGVHFDSVGNQYVIFQTTGDYTTGRDAGADQFIPVNNNVSINFPDVVFNQLDGAVPGAPISSTISDAVGHSSTITINSEGQIDWTN